MNFHLKILLIDREEKSRTTIVPLLKEIQGVDLRVEESWDDRVFSAVTEFQPDLLLINLAPDAMTGLDLVARLQKQYNNLMVIVTAPQIESDVIRRAMQSGVSDFLTQPFNREEVNTAIHAAIYYKHDKIRKLTKKGDVITLFGAKGGIGTTTLATNLAVALSRDSDRKVILVDMHLQLGQSALFLNLQSKYTISDVVQFLDNLDVQVFIKTLARHPSGAYVLPSPLRIEEADFITAQNVERLVGLLRENFDFILIDTQSYFDEVTIKALDSADRILLVSSLDLASIFNSKRCIELFTKMGYPSEKVLLALNCYAAYAGADLDALEKLLEFPVFSRIPRNNFATMLTSINQGVPIVEKSPSSDFGEGIMHLATRLMSPTAESEEEKSKGGFFKKLIKK